MLKNNPTACLAACAAALLLVPVPAALAQSTGVLRGLVTDLKGTPLPGVIVAVASAGQGVDGRGSVTDQAGTFIVPALPPGRDYRVRATLAGFAGVTLSDVQVEAGRAATVHLALPSETQVRERVEVRARPGVVNLEETTTQTRFSSEFVDALPILGRDYQDVLTLAPGVTDVDGDGNPNIHGARDTDVITLVDGVSTSDPLTGKIGAQLNIESIQEIQVKTAGATAEFGRAQGGFADVVTRSGGNEFQGTFKFFWRGSSLDHDGAGIDDPRLHAGVGESGLRDLRFNSYLPFLSVGGPLGRDRAWFYAANEYIHVDEPVNALNAAFVRGVREWREFVKLTWQAGANHRLALSVNYDPQEYLNEGLNSFTREESGYALRQGGTVVTARSTSVLSPLVVLETLTSIFDQRPEIQPNLGPDTNGDGRLWIDRNNNRFIEATERDPGDDYDSDGVFDVFEDENLNGRLDFGEDRDGDRRLTPYRREVWGGCEGELREDRNCNGRLDVNEDGNLNGVLDEGEDQNGDGLLEEAEDRNRNGVLDDHPHPRDLYPYGALRPQPGDRDYTIDRISGVTSGPYFEEFSDTRRRFTLRQDLGVFVPDFRGTHDLKAGVILERESFARGLDVRHVLSPSVQICEPPACEPPEDPAMVPPPVPTVSALLAAENRIDAEATSLSTGLYVQDNYRPVPGLSLGIGLRLDRELDSTYGYSAFDPATEARGFERMIALGGYGEELHSGILADPFFAGAADPLRAAGIITDPLQVAALGRLTRHHAAVAFDSDSLRSLGILPAEGEADPAELARRGVSPQTRESFSLTNHNLAPRLSVSWDPSAGGRTKLFATWGRYFDKLFLSTVVGEQGPDWINRYYLQDADGVSPSGTPNHQVGRLISKAPPSSTQIDRGLGTPFGDELTLGFEREIAPEVALSVTYVDRRYRRQLQDIDVNHFLKYDDGGRPLDVLGGLRFVLGPAGLQFSSRDVVPDGRPDLYIHNIFFNQVLRVGNYNEARYKGIEVTLSRRLARRWQMQGSYTYSRAVGDAEDFQSRLGNDPSTVEAEAGYLDYDQRHVVKVNAALFLPRDWQVGTSMIWSSGLPYSIVSRFFALDNLQYEQFRTRYGRIVVDPGKGLRFVPLRRNSERNDPVLDVNVQARKTVVFGRRTAALSLEIFNLLNRDDLRITRYEPNPFSRAVPSAASSPSPSGPLEVSGERRFGRRFQVGLRMEF